MSVRTGFSAGGNPLPIFIGHDGREPEATQVCIRSLLDHATRPLHITRLREPALRHIGLYHRTWHLRDGRKHDDLDGKPFSTEFSFTRFLVPSLMQHEGWALFCDADFLFLSDVAELFRDANANCAVMVVKHRPLPETGVKMDNQLQQPYFRKNWSSLILFNCEHPSNQRLTPAVVSQESGQWLHAFSWLEDSEIGTLSADWNYLAGVDPLPERDPLAVHFTLGIPTMQGHEHHPYAEDWQRVLSRL